MRGMNMRSVININKELIPYTFDILLGGKTFTIRVDYNATGDLFVLSLYKDKQLIRAGQPLIYGKKLWETVRVTKDFPLESIVPFDESGESIAVSFNNLNETVFLVIDDQLEGIG